MTCVLDECVQGRKPCPDPDVCCGKCDKPEPVRHHVCDPCETVAHCSIYGCIGYEAALPASFTADPPEVKKPWLAPLGARKPLAIDWQDVFVWGAVVLCFTAVTVVSTWRF